MPLIIKITTAALAVFLIYFFLTKKLKIFLLMAIGAFVVVLGGIRYNQVASVIPLSASTLSLGQKIVLEGVVVDEPQMREKNLRFVLEPTRIGVETIDTKTKFIISTDRYATISYGDLLRIEGKVTAPKNFLTDSGMEFDYVSYLAKDNIHYSIKNPDITHISSGHGSWIVTRLYTIKHAFAASISRTVSSPEDMLLLGILLGTRASFPESLTEDFVKTGTIHMVALSGYNVTIIAEMIMRVCALLPIALASSAGIIAIALFAILAGGGSTVLRASIMAVLLVLSRYVGRTYAVERALVFAASLMIAINPKILVSDVSFQLSFLATLGIVYLSPLIDEKLGWVTTRFAIRDILSGTLAAQIATFPLIVYKTGVFSIVSLPANMLVLPVVPMVMLSGFLTGVTGMLSSILVLPFSFVSYGLLHYILTVVKWFADLPFSAITIRHMPIIVVIGIYILLIWWVLRNEKSIHVVKKLQ
ncbi:MAG: ComEC family competence protein [Candidatus Pacebacteria bacterium]|jgi:competence protein ComEC|nr:ComEC family competence protein [Candidatus Paceibacterota bacterium]